MKTRLPVSFSATNTVLVLLPAELGAQGYREPDSHPVPAPAPPGHRGHSHGHQGGSDTSITWMVLLGDGLHNLTDGLAIGMTGGDRGSQGHRVTSGGGARKGPQEGEDERTAEGMQALPTSFCNPQVLPSLMASPAASAPP